MIYLDYNATAPMRPEVIDVMTDIMRHPYNPSSVHKTGRAARALVEKSRKTIADAIGCWPAELVFTASGTEANNMALKGMPYDAIAMSATEHASVLKTVPHAHILPVDSDGIVQIDALEQFLQEVDGIALVSIMLANNETGVIQPVKQIASLVHHYSGVLHCDAVQALGKITLDATLLGADLLSFSGHKLGASTGVGALFISQRLQLTSYITGGGQELGRRAGTEHVAGIVGFAKAVELAAGNPSWGSEIRTALDKMEQDAQALCPDLPIVLGRASPRLPNTSCLRMPGMSSQTQLMQFDLKGFAISAGSACSSGRIEPSHVVRAMLGEGYRDDVVRVSAGWGTTINEIQSFAEVWRSFMTNNKRNYS